jgi:4,5-dihydroxyphthalate decarboxylase
MRKLRPEWERTTTDKGSCAVRIAAPIAPAAKTLDSAARYGGGTMTDLKLNFACGLYDRLLPLYKGDVKPEGFTLDFQAIDDPRQIFDRMATGEFDVSEMSSSEHVTRIAAGNDEFVGIPIFVSRVFRHGFIFINRNADIRTPKDLAGKRIGVSAYTQTAAVFIRGLLQHDYDVDLSSVRWIQAPMNGHGGHPRPPKLTKPIDIVLGENNRSLSEMLAAGEIDATLGALVPDCFGRHADVQRLFPDFPAVEKDYYRRTHIFPIMHLIVIKRALQEKYPFIAPNLYAALSHSKDLAIERMKEVGALAYMLPWLPDHLREATEIFGADLWPYGVTVNRPTLAALVDYMVEQGLIAKPVAIEDLFVPGIGVS